MDRPLTGEPLPLDLLNTQWMEGGNSQDSLADLSTAAAWLAARGIEPAGEPARIVEHLRLARDAIRGALERPDEAAAYDAANAILASGHTRRRLDPDGEQAVVEVAEIEGRPAWLALTEFADLRAAAAGRIRRCEGHGCVLWFLDTTRSGSRRWCSMQSCGNRSKVRRHRARQGRDQSPS